MTKSKPMDYEGERTVEGFTEFLSKHCSNPVEVREKEDL